MVEYHDLENFGFLFNGGEKVPNAFKGNTFPINVMGDDAREKRLPIALTQVNTGKTSKILLNEIRQIIYPLYQLKEITRKVYNNIINSVQI